MARSCAGTVDASGVLVMACMPPQLFNNMLPSIETITNDAILLCIRLVSLIIELPRARR